MPRHITVKLLKAKDKTKQNKNLKVGREKCCITYRGKSIQMIVDFLSEAMKTKKKGHNISRAERKELLTQNSVFLVLLNKGKRKKTT